MPELAAAAIEANVILFFKIVVGENVLSLKRELKLLGKSVLVKSLLIDGLVNDDMEETLSNNEQEEDEDEEDDDIKELDDDCCLSSSLLIIC